MSTEQLPLAAPDSPSKRRARGELYNAVLRFASPGDVVFFISEVGSRAGLSVLSRFYRYWLGLAAEDATRWHTAIYSGPIKEGRSRWLRPQIIHACRDGVVEEHLPPSFFTSVRTASGSIVQSARVEIVQHPGLTDTQRRTIVDYCRGQLGNPFDDLGWRHDLLTYAFGLPSPRQAPGKVSCHGLAYMAYEQAGLTFPHRLADVPIFNLARYLGHPLGHRRDRANLRRLYLRDHHLYRDSRFTCVLALFDDPETMQLTVAEHPPKYSWSPKLREIYARRYGDGG